MAKPPIPGHYVEILEKPNPAVMATVRPDATPVSVATWYLWDEGRVLLNLDSRRKRLDHIRANPRVSLTVLDGESWYRHISMQGDVTLQPDPHLTDLDRIARHYTGQPFPVRDQERISIWLEIDTYHVWDPT